MSLAQLATCNVDVSQRTDLGMASEIGLLPVREHA